MSSFSIRVSSGIFFLLVLVSSNLAECSINRPQSVELDILADWSTKEEKQTLWEKFLNEIVPIFLGQKPNNIKGTCPQFRKYALADVSNDDVGNDLSVQQLIKRAKFKYETHYVLADDGYVTELVRLINPKADLSKLKQPPIFLAHGRLINPTAFVWASPIQHHPEVYPRSPEDGPITSWNRSIAFVLSNNGYDVWLPGARGTSRASQGHIKYGPPFAFRGSQALNEMKRRPLQTVEELANTFKYFDYSMDQVVDYELTRQVDKVLAITGASKVTYFAYSQTTTTGFMLLSSKPEYAERVHNFVTLAPILNYKGASRLVTLVWDILARLDEKLGTVLVSELIDSQLFRDFLTNIGRDKRTRYTLVKAIYTYLLGPSAKYKQLLDSIIISHVFETLGFKEAKHLAQVVSGELRKFDFGPLKNIKVYGSYAPPKYDISNLNVENWLIINAENDNLAPVPNVEIIKKTVKHPKPHQIFAPDYNHIDLSSAFDNDVYINLPILDYLDKHQLPSKGSFNTEDVDKLREELEQDELLKEYVPGRHSGEN